MTTIFDPSFYEILQKTSYANVEPRQDIPKLTGEIMLPSVVENPETSQPN